MLKKTALFSHDGFPYYYYREIETGNVFRETCAFEVKNWIKRIHAAGSWVLVFSTYLPLSAQFNSWTMFELSINAQIEQDPALTMQKTGWTIHSFFLVLSDLKKIFTLNVITRGQSTTIFLCIGPFLASWRTNEQSNNRVILEQACSWPVWEGSLLQKGWRFNLKTIWC